MPWYSPRRREDVAASTTVTQAPRRRSLVGAASLLQLGRRSVLSTPAQWQRECWDFYDNLGEFNYGVEWLASKISRLRLRAARLDPGIDEPVPITNGLAAELVEELAGDTAAQSELLATLAVHLSVPGESFLVGETINGQNVWQLRSHDEIRTQGPTRWQILDDEKTYQGHSEKWRDLSEESYVTRIWRPHRRLRHLASSPAQSARSVMRELDLVNRHIMAQYLSRLASAGMLILPDEVTFPVREEFTGAENPLVEEFIEMAKQAIATPGSAAAVIPIPMQMPGEFVGKVQFIDFTSKIDEKILEKRESAIKRLATKMDLPAEILLGMGDVNHWSAWQLDEDAIQTHIAPVAERIVHGLTVGYLHPRLKAAGEDFEQWAVWYDASELTQRPDRSDNAVLAYDRLEINGQALRRETGFDEDDAPNDRELADMILKFAARQPTTMLAALDELTGVELEDDTPDAAPVSGVGEPPDDADDVSGAEVGPPGTRDTPPPRARDVAARMIEQAKLRHALRIDGLNGTRTWELLHPPECERHLFSCPVSHATWDLQSAATPQTAGVYECWLNRSGEPIIGPMAPQLDVRDMFPTALSGRRRRDARPRS